MFRRGTCARCVLRSDLTEQLLTGPAENRDTAARLIETLCAAGRPESIFTWKRSPAVQSLLAGIGDGTITLTHEGLDALEVSRAVEHLRAILVNAHALPDRDPHLAQFQRWIQDKLAPLPVDIAHPVREFATWHHLRRIRGMAGKGSLRGPVHSAKQKITETIKFLTWLEQTHGRTAATCTQQDVDAYLSDGPTTRT